MLQLRVLNCSKMVSALGVAATDAAGAVVADSAADAAAVAAAAVVVVIDAADALLLLLMPLMLLLMLVMLGTHTVTFQMTEVTLTPRQIRSQIDGGHFDPPSN